MKFLLKAILIITLAMAMIAAMTGCAKQGPPAASDQILVPPDEPTPTPPATATPSPTPVIVPSGIPRPTFTTDPAGNTLEDFLNNMMELADEGRVINSEFPVKSVLEDVTAAWGEPDKSEYIADAKGTYVTYDKQNVVYAFNKGMQIFEVRSFDEQLKGITISAVIDVYGPPDYENTLQKQEIFGYIVNDEIKMLIVFDMTTDDADPFMDHYSVFYPSGTVNSMADDPGREW